MIIIIIIKFPVFFFFLNQMVFGDLQFCIFMLFFPFYRVCVCFFFFNYEHTLISNNIYIHTHIYIYIYIYLNINT